MVIFSNNFIEILRNNQNFNLKLYVLLNTHINRINLLRTLSFNETAVQVKKNCSVYSLTYIVWMFCARNNT